MPDGLEIRDVRLTPVEELSSGTGASDVRWYSLDVTVANVTRDPLYCISDVGRIRYDSARRAMVVQFDDDDNDDDDAGGRRPPMPAGVISVDPGSEATISFRISSPLVFIERRPEGQWATQSVTIPDDVGTVEVTVSYDTAPPVRQLNLASLDPLAWRDATWGTTVSDAVRLAGRARG